MNTEPANEVTRRLQWREVFQACRQACHPRLMRCWEGLQACWRAACRVSAPLWERVGSWWQAGRRYMVQSRAFQKAERWLSPWRRMAGRWLGWAWTKVKVGWHAAGRFLAPWWARVGSWWRAGRRYMVQSRAFQKAVGWLRALWRACLPWLAWFWGGLKACWRAGCRGLGRLWQGVKVGWRAGCRVSAPWRARVGSWWRAFCRYTARSVVFQKAVGWLRALWRACLPWLAWFWGGLKAWWRAGCLYLEYRARHAEAAAVERRRQALFLDIGTCEENRLTPAAEAERRGVSLAHAACGAAEERRAAAGAVLAAAARRMSDGQARCERDLADEHGRFLKAMDRVRSNRKDADARLALEDAVRRIKQRRWAWQEEYAQARREGLQLGQALAEAERGVAAKMAELNLARGELGAALFLAGGVDAATAGRVRALETDGARLRAEMKRLAETMRSLVMAGRRAALLAALIVALLLGGAIAYRSCRRASLDRQLQEIRRDVGRDDHKKTATEKAAEKEMLSEDLRLVE